MLPDFFETMLPEIYKSTTDEINFHKCVFLQHLH